MLLSSFRVSWWCESCNQGERGSSRSRAHPLWRLGEKGPLCRLLIHYSWSETYKWLFLRKVHRCDIFFFQTITVFMTKTELHILGILTQQKLFFFGFFSPSESSSLWMFCYISDCDIILDGLNSCVQINKRMDGSMYKFCVCIYFTVYYISKKEVAVWIPRVSWESFDYSQQQIYTSVI